MEAPEKVYIDDFGSGFSHGWHTEHSYEKDIEYVRKDAFIEKTEKFFTEKFEVEDYNDNIDVDGSPIFNYCRFIENFKKYMEE